MPFGFKAGNRAGIHYELVDLAVRKSREANLAVKGRSEHEYELSVMAHLQSSPTLKKNLITQIGEDEVEKIQQAQLFGFKHRPDSAIGLDGTAIEIKVIYGAPDIRNLFGQAIAYRMDYRFVILVLIDGTDGRQIVELCQDKNSREHEFLSSLADELNIFTIVGPVSQGKNLAFS